MSIEITLNTEGQPISTEYSRIWRHSELDFEMALLCLRIGGAQLNIHFNTHQEMIDFCNSHNFAYRDDRNPLPLIEVDMV
jgi:hypothetical protein